MAVFAVAASTTPGVWETRMEREVQAGMDI